MGCATSTDVKASPPRRPTASPGWCPPSGTSQAPADDVPGDDRDDGVDNTTPEMLGLVPPAIVPRRLSSTASSSLSLGSRSRGVDQLLTLPEGSDRHVAMASSETSPQTTTNAPREHPLLLPQPERRGAAAASDDDDDDDGSGSRFDESPLDGHPSPPVCCPARDFSATDDPLLPLQSPSIPTSFDDVARDYYDGSVETANFLWAGEHFAASDSQTLADAAVRRSRRDTGHANPRPVRHRVRFTILPPAVIAYTPEP